MASKERAPSNDKALSAHQGVRPEAQSAEMQDQQMVPASSAQKATMAPHLLLPHDMLQLQRALGNRAVSRLLGKAKLPTTPLDTPVLQRTSAAQLQGDDPTVAQQANETGMPDSLKSGIETLSGIGLDDLTVHYSSSEPAQLQSLAYAQGSDIYVGPGQERHLPHEAWHVVQQRQGRVQPTVNLEGAEINDDPALEQEADVMGARALQMPVQNAAPIETRPGRVAQRKPVIQMAITGVTQIGVADIAQSKTNRCWAAAGWCIHQHAGGTAYTTEKAFVTAKGDTTAQSDYRRNRPTDIDRIIGSSSGHNRLSGSEKAKSYSKAAISRELNKNKPIVANVSKNHYVVICGKRKNDGDYQLEIMDPGSGSKSWEDTTGPSATRIATVGGYTLSVLYYTK